MLADVLARMEAGEWAGAGPELERIQAMAPAFLPSYIALAQVYEQDGDLARAEAQWVKLMDRGTTLPVRAMAEKERDRVAGERARLARERVEAGAETASGKTPPARAVPPGERVPEKTVRIFQVERERFKSTDDYDEMRLLRIEVEPHGPTAIETDKVSISVTFFDRGDASGEVWPTRAMVPDGPLRPAGAWVGSERRTVTAAYIVPKGFREGEQRDRGEGTGYYGYVVQLFYGDALQDQFARPVSLLQAM